jgi:hypothetical protein
VCLRIQCLGCRKGRTHPSGDGGDAGHCVNGTVRYCILLAPTRSRPRF